MLDGEGVDALIDETGAEVGEEEEEQRMAVNGREDAWCSWHPWQPPGEECIDEGEDGEGYCGVENLGREGEGE